MEEEVNCRKHRILLGSSLEGLSFAFVTLFHSACIKVQNALEANSPKLKEETSHRITCLKINIIVIIIFSVFLIVMLIYIPVKNCH